MLFRTPAQPAGSEADVVALCCMLAALLCVARHMNYEVRYTLAEGGNDDLYGIVDEVGMMTRRWERAMASAHSVRRLIGLMME